ncbi:MAG: tRNA preQ1(34) S-adenosylmethionine ribosyltransferase-isomerase QueA [Planctomycetota bacterium]
MPSLDEYDYELPRELIAQYPLSCRSDARLLVVSRRDQSLTHAHVRDVGCYLRAGDYLVLNNTRVVPARLLGYRVRTGGRWSGLFVTSDPAGNWEVMSKTRGTLRPGDTVMLQDRMAQDAFPLRMLADLGESLWAARPAIEGTPSELLERVGRVPLPPYIRSGEMEASDREYYQTVFAQRPGAIAAPTAGLHFTRELLDQLTRNGIGLCFLTLHVGIGTFRPIKVNRVEEHRMHSEWCEVSAEAVEQLNACRAAGGRIVAVGTTCARALESAARDGTLRPWQGQTNLFIRPPFTFQATDALLTNFHLPRSTLLILVRAFGGDALIKRAYQSAIEENYRFFSYGDAMLIV